VIALNPRVVSAARGFSFFKVGSMSEVAEKLKNDLLALSEQDRAQIAYLLLESLGEAEDPETVDAAWEKELQRRWGEIERGEDQGTPLPQGLNKGYRSPAHQ
jgi:putative addiction module component (TIGR02574 family)